MACSSSGWAPSSPTATRSSPCSARAPSGGAPPPARAPPAGGGGPPPPPPRAAPPRETGEGGPPPPREAFDVAIQVAKGLEAIHAADVLHRDLKTSNIMRDARGYVRLLDFGIAKRATPSGTLALTGVAKAVGTPEYMSPEQIRGEDLDARG